MHSPVAELMRTFSMTVPLFPSITTGPDGASEVAGFDGVGVGDVLGTVGAGVGEELVALGVALGVFVALGELLVAGLVVAPEVGAVLGCEGFDVGVCVVGAGMAVGVAVFVVVGAAGVGTVVVGAVGEAVSVGVGEAVGVAVAPPLATLTFPRRLDLLPSDQVSTALMVCDPSASFVVSKGFAVPPAAVPAKSKGATLSVRMGGFARCGSSR
jgi:hypothetical protein